MDSLMDRMMGQSVTDQMYMGERYLGKSVAPNSSYEYRRDHRHRSWRGRSRGAPRGPASGRDRTPSMPRSAAVCEDEA
jgi:hypothetical protein